MNRSSDNYVTKFFEKESLPYFEKGSVRFGTLGWYAAEENRTLQGARLDTGEGSSTIVLSTAGESVEDLCYGPFDLKGPADISLDNIHISNEINAYVFCSSNGEYSTELHRSILCPSANGYPGNPNLTGYVTFNKGKLLKALFDIAARNYDLPRPLPTMSGVLTNWMSADLISYGDRTRDEIVTSGYRGPSWDACYVKPRFFTPENEFRVILNKDHPSCVPEDADGFILEGPEILDAMCIPPSIISDAERQSWLGRDR